MQQKRKVIVVFVFLVVQTQCGVIDNLYGRVKNTTTGLKQDVKNVWSFSKSLVGLEEKNTDTRPEAEKRGFIGGMLHSTKEKIHSIRNYFWNTDEYTGDAGLFGNMYNRVKNRLIKTKDFILGDDENNWQAIQPPSKENKVITDTFNKLFFRNGTRQVHGHAFQEAIDNLRKKLQDIRNNVTASTTLDPAHHGEGLIDIRTAYENVQGDINDNVASINNDIYDRADDLMKAVSEKTANNSHN